MGPQETGKTSLAERMCRFYDDLVLIPRFASVDGELISVYDPSLHQAVPEQPPGLDPRYVLCERPLIMVGGGTEPGNDGSTVSIRCPG